MVILEKDRELLNVIRLLKKATYGGGEMDHCVVKTEGAARENLRARGGNPIRCGEKN